MLRSLRALFVTVVALGLSAGELEAAPFAEEYRIKAAFLFNFAKFVEWPAEANLPEPGRHVFCVYGADPFGAVLDQTLAGKLVEGRAAVVRRVREPEALRACHLVFVPAAEEAALPRIVAALGQAPVLLVGESPGFAGRGGMINFFPHEERLRFEIHPAALQRARLKASVQLLDLARIVGPAGPRPDGERRNG